MLCCSDVEDSGPPTPPAQSAKPTVKLTEMDKQESHPLLFISKSYRRLTSTVCCNIVFDFESAFKGAGQFPNVGSVL